MKRKISVTDLKTGMYICKFNGAWLDNPFWRKELFLSTDQDLQLLRSSSIKSVWVDCLKSSTPCQEIVFNGDHENALEMEQEEYALESNELVPASIEDEIVRAAQIIDQSKKAVSQMFQQARMGVAIDVEIAEAVAQEVTNSVMRNSLALISLARFKTADDYTYMHSVAVCALMAAMARHQNFSQADIRQAAFAGLMHDIGKSRIPEEILKKTTKLSDEEFEIVKNHPVLGLSILQSLNVEDCFVLDVCLHHHERMDGTGYPEKLSEGSISTIARIGAICDVYDAITSDRPYKKGWDPAESLSRMAKWCGTHLDTKLFHAFVKVLGVYPVGSLVRLDNGLLGVVSNQNPDALLKPVVKIFFSTQTMQLVPVLEVDLATPDCTQKIIQKENPKAWPLGDWEKLWLPQNTTSVY